MGAVWRLNEYKLIVPFFNRCLFRTNHKIPAQQKALLVVTAAAVSAYMYPYTCYRFYSSHPAYLPVLYSGLYWWC